MHFLYILKSVEHNRHYIGVTENITERLNRHNHGEVRSTKAYRPWHIAYVERFSDKTAARKREIFLKKTAKERERLYNRIDLGPIV